MFAMKVIMAAMVATAAAAMQISSLDELYQAIVDGPKRTVGFLSEGNAQELKTVLPPSVENGGPLEVYIDGNQTILEEMVSNGVLLAVGISGRPEDEDGRFVVFSSKFISLRTSFMLRQAEADTDDLASAFNTALVHVVENGNFIAAIESNPPFEATLPSSCAIDSSSYSYPSFENATGVLLQALTNSTLKIGALGPFNWGVDGNYQAQPHTGFWPDYAGHIESEFQAHYGSEAIKIERVWYPSSQLVFEGLINGEFHLTEPYFVLSAFFNGKPRQEAFRTSCITAGYESNFFVAVESEQNDGDGDSDEDDDLPRFVIPTIVVSAVALLALIVISVMVVREKSGSPLFKPLTESSDGTRTSTGSQGNQFPNPISNAESQL